MASLFISLTLKETKFNFGSLLTISRTKYLERFVIGRPFEDEFGEPGGGFGGELGAEGFDGEDVFGRRVVDMASQALVTM